MNYGVKFGGCPACGRRDCLLMECARNPVPPHKVQIPSSVWVDKEELEPKGKCLYDVIVAAGLIEIVGDPVGWHIEKSAYFHKYDSIPPALRALAEPMFSLDQLQLLRTKLLKDK